MSRDNVGKIFNVPQCGMDGGDCNNFNLFYPGCNEIPDASKIDASKIGNGECDGYPYHSRECSYDGFDCEKEVVVKEKYNLCLASVPSFATKWSLIENDTCDMVRVIIMTQLLLFKHVSLMLI